MFLRRFVVCLHSKFTFKHPLSKRCEKNTRSTTFPFGSFFSLLIGMARICKIICIHGHRLGVSSRLLTVLFLHSLIFLPSPVPLFFQFFPSGSCGIRRGFAPVTSDVINNHLLHFFFVLIRLAVTATNITICISASRPSSFARKRCVRFGSRRPYPMALWPRRRRGTRALGV